jgi:Peptidase family C25/Propeptide_C25/Secretion system C-terminal sorting domain/Peptidase family C25, C terminal ig-like domain
MFLNRHRQRLKFPLNLPFSDTEVQDFSVLRNSLFISMKFSIYRAVIFFVFLTGPLFAQEWIPLSSSMQPYSLQFADADNRLLKVHLNGFFKMEDGASSTQIIKVPGLTDIDSSGLPDLPKISFSLQVPESGIAEIKITNEEYVEFTNYTLKLSDGIGGRAGKDENNSTIKKTKETGFWPEDRIHIEPLYHLHNGTGQPVWLYPFSYNEVTQTLRVYTHFELEIIYFDNEVNPEPSFKKISKEFNELYKRQFINYLDPASTSINNNNALLILCTQPWISDLQPLADWKNQSGVETTIADISAISNDAVAIKNYIYNYYQQHFLTHVLIAGDHSVIASPFSAAAGGPSDPSYGYLSGNDSYPEVFVGRFPAESDSDIITMVQRVIDYEKTPDTTVNWMSNALGIGSNLGPGDDNEMDWEHLSNIRTQLLSYTYSNVEELYDGTHPGTTDLPGNPNPTDVINSIQSGVSLINYTGHGNNNSFTTSGFSNNEINLLTNTGQLPFIWSAGCTNGNFTTAAVCMGESFLRARYNGKPAGAVAALMSSVNQYWNPPMDAQDAMNAILTLNDTTHTTRTFGGISFSGCMQMNDHYGAAGALMTDTWHCFGDPSLEVRTAFPVSLSVSHAPSLTIGDSAFTVFCSTDGARVTLFHAGKIISNAIINGGSAMLEFSPLVNQDSILITLSGFNLYPYISKIPVLAAPGPYVILKSFTNNEITGNNNGSVEINEVISCDITFMNAGLTDAKALTLQVITADTSIIIPNVTPLVFSLNSGDSTLINAAFQYIVSDSIKDQQKVLINVIVTDTNSNHWTSEILQTLNAPELYSSVISIDDSQAGNSDGIADAGESFQIKIRYINSGHSNLDTVFAKISSVNPDLILLSDSNAFRLNSQSDTIISFNAQLSPATVLNSAIELSSNIYYGFYQSDSVYVFVAGYEKEDFETGDFSSFNWQFSGNVPWIISNILPFEGQFSAQSGDIDDNEESILKILLHITRRDSLSFKYKVNSEPVWDVFEVRTDSISRFTASGVVGWTPEAFLIDTGIHVIDFIYRKDNVFTSGLDAAWLDEIRFPPFTSIVSVNTIYKDKNSIIYPNPADDFITIENLGNVNSQIYIYDVNGSIVYKNLISISSDDKIAIPVAGWKDGIYMLIIQNEKELEKAMFIIQH